MKNTRTIRRVLLLGLVVALTACAAPKPEPKIASAASEPGYATAYASRLQATDQAFDSEAGVARQSTTAFEAYPSALSEPDWAAVLEVHRAANAAGQSRTYYDGARDNQAVRTFHDTYNADITRKVAGSAQSAVTKAVPNTEVDVAGPVAYGLKEGVNKSLEKQLRAANAAHAIIEEKKDALGKKNAEVLGEQADELARTAYRVYIQVPELAQQIDRMKAEAKDVSDTLTDEMEEAQRITEDPGATKEQKDQAIKRSSELSRSRDEANAAALAITKTDEAMLKEIDALQNEYEKAFEALEDTLEKLVDEQAEARKNAPPAKTTASNMK